MIVDSITLKIPHLAHMITKWRDRVQLRRCWILKSLLPMIVIWNFLNTIRQLVCQIKINYKNVFNLHNILLTIIKILFGHQRNELKWKVNEEFKLFWAYHIYVNFHRYLITFSNIDRNALNWRIFNKLSTKGPADFKAPTSCLE